MIHDVFWRGCSSVSSGIRQQHRARRVDIIQVGLGQNRNLCICARRPAPQMRSLCGTRRLVGARYQLVQAGIVGNGRQQEDPAVRWPGKYAYTDAICRNVLTPLVHRFRKHAVQ